MARVPALTFMILSLAAGVSLGGEVVTRDGVPHVLNPAEVPGEPETLRLEELWRAGGELDEETIFGVITQGLTDEDGKVYLLDMQLSQVSVYSPDGERVGTLSREGEGPGEVRNPTDMLFMHDGTLGIVQMFPGRIIKVTREDAPAGQILVGGDDPMTGGFAAVVDARQRAGNLVLAGVNLRPNETGTGQIRDNYLASFGEDGAEKVRYWAREGSFDFTDFALVEQDLYTAFPRRWAIGLEGEVYLVPERDAYRIEVKAADGELLRVIERAYAPRDRTAQETRIMRQALEAQGRQFPGEVRIEIEETEPAIQRIDVATDGTIWVLHADSTHEQPEGVMLTFDVFDPEGHLIRQVQVACEGNGKEDALIFAGDDCFVLIRGALAAGLAMHGPVAESDDGEEPEPVEVIYYRLAKG